jgi:hypothetical protein
MRRATIVLVFLLGVPAAAQQAKLPLAEFDGRWEGHDRATTSIIGSMTVSIVPTTGTSRLTFAAPGSLDVQYVDRIDTSVLLQVKSPRFLPQTQPSAGVDKPRISGGAAASTGHRF